MDVLEYPTLTVDCIGLRQRRGHGNASGRTGPTLMEESGMAGPERAKQSVHGLLERVERAASDNRSFMRLPQTPNVELGTHELRIDERDNLVEHIAALGF